MREFGIAFIKGFKTGLRPFGNSSIRDERLIECFNLRPTEEGLQPRDDLSVVDAELKYTYFCIQDEEGGIWCIYIDIAGQIMINIGPPLNIDGYRADNISIDPLPRYVQMPAINEPELTLYIYVDVTGGLIIDFTEPGGTGYACDYMRFASPNGYQYNVVTINTLELVARPLL